MYFPALSLFNNNFIRWVPHHHLLYTIQSVVCMFTESCQIISTIMSSRTPPQERRSFPDKVLPFPFPQTVASAPPVLCLCGCGGSRHLLKNSHPPCDCLYLSSFASWRLSSACLHILSSLALWSLNRLLWYHLFSYHSSLEEWLFWSICGYFQLFGSYKYTGTEHSLAAAIALSVFQLEVWLYCFIFVHFICFVLAQHFFMDVKWVI